MPIVAVVGNDPCARSDLAGVLWAADYQVAEFGEGAAPLSELEAPLDVVILDLDLGETDGLSVFQGLRGRGYEGPVFLTSTFEVPEDVDRAYELGVTDCLCAPVLAPLLLTKIKRALLPDRILPPRGEDPKTELLRVAGYSVVSELGHGRCSRVYRAHDLRLGRTVALKLVRPHALGERDLARFLREATVLSHARLPHTARVLDWGYSEGSPYLALELVEGRNLRELLDLEGPLPIERVRVVARCVALALESMRMADLVHRDVKPGNLVLSPDRRSVTLVDFGLAKSTTGSQDLTEGEAVLGTAPYIAPELLEGAEARASSDVYALGVTLFVLLTGRLPHWKGTAISTLDYVATRPEPPMLPRHVPPLLTGLVRTMLDPDPQERPSPCTIARALRPTTRFVPPFEERPRQQA